MSKVIDLGKKRVEKAFAKLKAAGERPIDWSSLPETNTNSMQAAVDALYEERVAERRQTVRDFFCDSAFRAFKDALISEGELRRRLALVEEHLNGLDIYELGAVEALIATSHGMSL